MSPVRNRRAARFKGRDRARRHRTRADRSRKMQHRIIVLGAGYAGAIAAGRLARRLRREEVAITLVNAEPDFVERVRMHQLAAGQGLKSRPFSEMFAGTGVELRLAEVTGVDVDGKTVAVVDA